MTDFLPAKTGLGRVWLIDGRARPDHKPSYEHAMKSSGISRGLGDVEKIEVNDPNKYNSFDEIGEVQGADERGTATLTGRYALDTLSAMLQIANKNCRLDVQVHFGLCEDPTDFGAGFQKVMIFENAKATNYSQEDLTALESGDRAKIDETLDISAKDAYEVVPLRFSEEAASVVTNEVLRVRVCDSASCGDCEDESDGNSKFFALTKASGGSPSTQADIVYSLDRGANWYAHDVDSLGAGDEPDDFACFGGRVVVISNATDSLNYATLSDFKAGTGDPAFTQVTTGFVAAGSPNALDSVGSKAWIVGDGGYIYVTEDPTSGVTVQDAGESQTDKLLAVHALSSKFALAGGQNGAVVVTENGENWQEVTPRPVGVGIHINTVWAKSKSEWFIGTSNGRIYHTLNGGESWTWNRFPGDNAGAVEAIHFWTDSVVRFSHTTAAPLGRIIESIGGGHPDTWKVLPLGSGNLPANDKINSLAGGGNPNVLIGGGLGDDASDGFVVLGLGSGLL